MEAEYEKGEKMVPKWKIKLVQDNLNDILTKEDKGELKVTKKKT